MVPDDVLRFALYGRANAGKTCILAALAMPHVTADGLACVWRGNAADAPRPAGVEGDWPSGDPTVARFRGAEWLRNAVRALESGAVPPPNPNNRDPFRFRYDFKDRGFDYPVELVDYSGELLDPAVSLDDLALRLRQHLRECDAVLVLAECPRSNEGGGDLAGELYKLQMAFALLRSAGDGTLPGDAVVGLVVNKWDRRAGAVDSASLDNFLTAPEGEAHRRLRDALRTREPHDFAVFAASAFGRSRREGQAEAPTGEVPLPSIGLEEPFIWAARRCHEKAADRELGQVEAEAQQCGWWRVLQPLTGKRGRLTSSVTLMRERFPPDFPHHQRAVRALEGTAGAWRPQLAGLAVCVFLFWGVATVSRDRVAYGDHRDVLTGRVDADLPRGDVAEAWLARYVDRNFFWSPFSRAVLSADTGRERLADLRTRLPDLREKAARDRENRAALDAWGKRLDVADGAKGLTGLRATTSQLPWPEAASPGVREDLLTYQHRLDAKLEAAIADESCTELERDYYTRMGQRDVRGAASVLSKVGIPPAKLDGCRKHFSPCTLEILRDEVESGKRDARWADTRDKLKGCRDDEFVKRLLSAQQQVAIDELVLDLNLAHDRALYDRARRDRTADACARYLNESPLPTPRMKPFVQKYADYLATMKADLEFTISLTRIDWGKDSWSSETDNGVDVWLNGSAAAQISKRNVTSRQGTTTSEVDTFKWKGKLDDQVTIKVKIWCHSGNFVASNRSQGEGAKSMSLRDLTRQDCEVPLDRYGNKAYFKVEGGVPGEPPLPVYQE